MTPDQKETIIRLKEEQKWFWKDIGVAVNLKPATCRKFYQRYVADRDLPPKVVISKSIITARQGLLIKREMVNNNRTSVRRIAAVLAADATPGTPTPSKSTVHRYLQIQLFQRATAIRKPLLRAANVERRLLFAQDLSGMDKEFFGRILWSDETMVRAYPSTRKIQVWVRKTVEDENMAINPTIQHGGVSVMFWGCFSRRAWGPLIVCEGKQKAADYLKLIQDHVEPELEASEVPLIFMQDNCSIHKAKTVMDHLAQKEIQTLDWPPQSPDLNPIENVWAIIKQKLYQNNRPPATKDELIRQVFEIWESFDETLLQRLSDSFPKRLRDVITKKGQWLKH